MRIILISESVSSLAGGLQNSVVGLARSLASMGLDVKIIAGSDEGDKGPIDLDIEYIEMRGRAPLRYFPSFERVVTEFKPDFISMHGLWNLIVFQVFRYCKKYKLPYVISTHGMLDPYILNKNKIAKCIFLLLIQKRCLRDSRFVRALNVNEVGHVSSIIDCNIVNIPNGLNGDPPSSLSVARSDNRILSLGRIDHKKGTLELVVAWRNLDKKLLLPRGSELIIAGWHIDDAYFNKVRNMAEGCSSIKLVGPVFGHDKWIQYHSAGAFILPSKGEGLPNTVLEAWACSALPIITEECNFSSDEMRYGAISIKGDVEGIEEGLVKFFNLSSAQRDEITRNGARYVEKYSWPVVADSFVKSLLNV